MSNRSSLWHAQRTCARKRKHTTLTDAEAKLAEVVAEKLGRGELDAHQLSIYACGEHYHLGHERTPGRKRRSAKLLARRIEKQRRKALWKTGYVPLLTLDSQTSNR